MRKILSLAAIVSLTFAAAHFSVKAAAQTPAPAPSLPPIIATQNAPAPAASAQLAIVIDPAHGATDSGARGSNGINEKDVTLALGRGIRAELTRQGYRVTLTRDADVNPSYDDRDASANAFADAIFVSIHVASTGTPGTVRAYYYREPTPLVAAAGAGSAVGTIPLPGVAAVSGGLVPWRDAQTSYDADSHRLAGLIQSALAQKFSGSPTDVSSAAARELRSVAAPAIAIEISNISSPNVSTLESMSPAIANAIAQSISVFHPGGVLNGTTSTTGAAGATH